LGKKRFQPGYGICNAVNAYMQMAPLAATLSDSALRELMGIFTT
jgi:hypothetical protein